MPKHFRCLIALIALTACTRESYETGDSDYSYLRSDFVEIRTDAQSRFFAAMTDDEAPLLFRTPLSSHWAKRPDSTYRALLHYNKKGETIEPIAASQVPVLPIYATGDSLQAANDPVHFNSSWVSRNRKYLNLGLTLMTGVVKDEEKHQTIGILCDSVTTVHGKKTYYLHLHHLQNNVPEYYSSRIFVSIPTTKFRAGDTIRLRMKTYDGILDKSFIF